MENDDDENPSAPALIALIQKEFRGVDRPVTAEELADMYGVIAAQHEAIMACFKLTMRVKPDLIFEDEVVHARREILTSVNALTGALKKLARASMSDDDKAKLDE
ncbi:MAG: hypothetical protein V7786_01830 [Sulfitobacter litoralis]|uniref:hypothetical protein n=1 Tax=Sulfitobacter litoralis TaxID=335975 RepID=UPI0030027021